VPRVNCFIPITVRVTGQLGPTELNTLSDSLVRALQARLASADRLMESTWSRATSGAGAAAAAPARESVRASRLRLHGADSRERSNRFLRDLQERNAAFRGARVARIEGDMLLIGGTEYSLVPSNPLAELETVGSKLRGGAVYLAPTDRRALGVVSLAAGDAFRVFTIDMNLRLRDTGMRVLARGLSSNAAILGYVDHTLRFAETLVQARKPRDTAALADAVVMCIDVLPVTLAPLQTVMAILAHLEPEGLTPDEMMDILRRVGEAGRLTQLVSLIQIPRWRAYLRGKGVPWDYIYSHWEPGVNDSGQLWAGFMFGAAENVYEAARFFYVIIGSLVSKELENEGVEMAQAIKKFFAHPLVNAKAGISHAYADFQEKLWNLEFFDAGRVLGNAVVALLTLYEGVTSLPKALRALGQVAVNLARLTIAEVRALGVTLQELGKFLRDPPYAIVTATGPTLVDAEQAVMVVASNGAPVGLIGKDEIAAMMAATGAGGGGAVAAGEVQALAEELVKRGAGKLVEEVLDELEEFPEDARAILRRLKRLTDRQLGGLDAIREADLTTHGVVQWQEVLDMPAAFRNDLLDLVADVKDSVRNGLAEAVARGMRANSTDIQGVLGHFYAARTLKAHFPGALLDFEFETVGREIDIRVVDKGRVIDVEVKTNLADAPSVDTGQIANDLARHAADGWQDLLYMYAPQQSGNIDRVQRAMVRLLQDPVVAQAVSAAGMTADSAQKTLLQRFIDGMVTTFDY
jgi:hypothetical protein